MAIMIDPPIYETASAETLRGFLRDLDRAESRMRSDAEALRTIAEVRAETQEWLRRKESAAAA
ncbi:MAG: hypothetical protein ACREM1_22760 [Longimicrobiales bacterium]